jgi:hypothetical protein
MKARWVVGSVLAVFLGSMAGPAAAGQGDKIVRVKSSLDGLRVVNAACRLLGCSVLGSLDTVPDQPAQPSSLFLVRGLVDNTVTFLLGLLGLASIEPDLPVALAQDDAWACRQASAAVVDQLWDRTPTSYYGTTAWHSYVEQPASGIVRVRDAHCDLRATGSGIVAVIDTGVDPTHPALQGVLTAGYDFTRNSGGGDEKTDVTQASAAVVDGVHWVNGSTAACLDQASAAVVDDGSHSAFGHGTMVAGVVHLVAPTARIMPLKAFGPDGTGYTSDILRSINFAVQKGAKVLNMSFSRPTSSPELRSALDNANKKGVIAVASAGNDDTRSSFSNYGSKLVSLAAPGEGIITTYPWASYAAAWGTSFSTPFVSGAAALLVGMQGSATPSQVAWAVAHAKPLTSDLGNGRLDLYQAVGSGRSLWPNAPSSQVPDSCASSDGDWSAAP